MEHSGVVKMKYPIEDVILPTKQYCMRVTGSSCTSLSIIPSTIGMSSDTANSYTCAALMAKFTVSKHFPKLMYLQMLKHTKQPIFNGFMTTCNILYSLMVMLNEVIPK